jgi:hypothetical protein
MDQSVQCVPSPLCGERSVSEFLSQKPTAAVEDIPSELAGKLPPQHGRVGCHLVTYPVGIDY